MDELSRYPDEMDRTDDAPSELGLVLPADEVDPDPLHDMLHEAFAMPDDGARAVAVFESRAADLLGGEESPTDDSTPRRHRTRALLLAAALTAFVLSAALAQNSLFDAEAAA